VRKKKRDGISTTLRAGANDDALLPHIATQLRRNRDTNERMSGLSF
jgi:hypothetical protein